MKNIGSMLRASGIDSFLGCFEGCAHSLLSVDRCATDRLPRDQTETGLDLVKPTAVDQHEMYVITRVFG
jgi:hypothetical protein